MKLLIVDDEKHVREVICLLIDWQKHPDLEILEATDGQMAMDIIEQESPQIILTDMLMPIKNGAELLSWINENAPQCKTIVISGHGDFSLLRHTIQYGGIDYLLKPLDGQILNDTIAKAIDLWKSEEHARLTQQEKNIAFNQMRLLYWDKILTEFTKNLKHEETIKYLLTHEFGVMIEFTNAQIGLFDTHTLSHFFLQKFNYDRELLLFSLINIINEKLKEHHDGIAFRHWDQKNEILIWFWKDTTTTKKILEEMNRIIFKIYGFRLDIGLGNIHPFPEGLKLSFEEASHALQIRSLIQRNSWIHQATTSQLSERSSLQFSQYADQFRLTLQSGHFTQIEEVVDQWIQAVQMEKKMTAEQVDKWRNDYFHELSKWIREFVPQSNQAETIKVLLNHDFNNTLPIDERGLLSLPLWTQQMRSTLTKLAQILIEHQYKDNNIIYEISKYVDKHYQENLTLQDISSHFYLSREYISRKFKQEFKVNFSDYLSNIRINKSKLLLLNPHLRIAKIAEQVGYPDVKYFSKVFKKLTGKSPNEYRKQHE
jgi:two-component system response regulator YesN